MGGNLVSPQDICDMFAESIRRGQQATLEKSGHADVTEIHVTDICRFTTYCPRALYYDKVSPRPPTVEAQIKFNFGHAIHETPINPDGNEFNFSALDVKCRMDDVHMGQGWICDKKSVSTIPKEPNEYVTKQLNIYKYIAEHDKERPFKVNQLFVLYISIYNGNTVCLPVQIWDEEFTKEFIERNRDQIKLIVKIRDLPEIKKGWWCKNCQYPDYCMQHEAFDRDVDDTIQKDLEPKREEEPDYKNEVIII